MTSPSVPPAWVERLLDAALAHAVYRDDIVGDLREAYGNVAARTSRPAAVAWYALEALRLAVRYGFSRRRQPSSDMEAGRARRHGAHMDRLVMDLRFAVRSILKRPLVAATIVVTLALAIGANTAVFGVIDAMVLHPFAMHDVDRIVMPVTTMPTFAGHRETVSPADFLDWRRRLTGGTIEHLAAVEWWDANLMGRDDPERVLGFFVSPEFFSTVDAHAALGRTFLPDEEVAANGRRIVLSDGLWRRRFGADPAIVGQAVMVDGATWTIVGVMPPGFDFPQKAELWAPWTVDEARARQRGARTLTVIGRLAANRTLAAAQAQMTTIVQQLAREYPDTNRDTGVVVYTLSKGMADAVVPAVLGLWQAAGLFVLLIACANIANLLLARGAEREREIAIRLALGSTRLRIVRLAVLESGAMVAVAMPLALALTWVYLRLIYVSMPARIVRFIAGFDRLGLNLRLGTMAVAIGIVATLACGLVPALQLARGHLSDSLKADTRTSIGSRQRLRRALVVAEIALALPLLVATMMSVVSVTKYVTGWQGYDPRGVLTARIALPEARYPDAEHRRRFVTAALAAIAAAPTIDDVAIANILPAEDSNEGRRVEIADHPEADVQKRPRVDYRAVSPSYFAVLRIPILAGRAFTESDEAAAEPVAIVSEAMARRFWPNGTAVGSRVRTGSGAPARVVAICGDVIHDWYDTRNAPTLLRPIAQEPPGDMMIAARTHVEPATAVDDLRHRMATVDRMQPLFDIMPMTQLLSEKTISLRYIAAVMGVFAALAIVLALVGLYAVMSYLVAQRVREIGVRMALGATASDVTRLTLREAARLTAGGVLVGAIFAVALGRVMEAGLLVVQADGRLTVALATAFGLTALAASYLPARRAASIDPIAALRDE